MNKENCALKLVDRGNNQDWKERINGKDLEGCEGGKVGEEGM